MKNKNYAHWLFTAVLLMMIIALMGGCITLYEKKPGDSKPGAPAAPPAATAPAAGAPAIKSFTALPKSVAAGQPSQLQWEVTGATAVEINPVVGKVNQSDTVLVSPTATTTYTLTATNAAGSRTATVVVTVGASAGAAPAASRPDLTVTEISLITKGVYYRAKNIGTAPSKGSRTYLFVNGIKEADDYLEPLDPGQERISPFSSYSWDYSLGDFANLPGNMGGEKPRQFTLKVCVDVENVVVEADESNNCRSVIWGEKFTYPFVTYAHQATWTTGYGALTRFPLPEENATGAALVTNASLEDNKGSGQVLLAVPQQVNDGYIMGVFGEFYTDDLRQTRVRDIELPDMAKFSALVGFTNSSPPGSKAKFTFGVVEQSGLITFLPAVTASYDGKLDLYEVDLSSRAGQKLKFVLRIDAIGSADKMRPVWVDPRIFQP